MKKKRQTLKSKSLQAINKKAGWLKLKANPIEELMKEKKREKEL